MVDVFTKQKRSEIMSHIRSRETRIEKDFLKLLSAKVYPKGYRYRKYYTKLPGKPDIVFVKHRVAIFIDGDFWHGYKLKQLQERLPKKYWRGKIESNIARDKKHNAELRKQDWKVLRFWEHEVKKNPERAIEKILHLLKKK